MNNKNNKTIFIIGLPGCGKSSLSEILAKHLNYDLYDMDSLIEEREKRNITNIFSESGQAYFRNIESKVLQELSNLNNVVISTGGGIVLSNLNRNIMKDKGISIFIDRSPEIILQNIDSEKRPLLSKDKNKLIELSNQRDALYRDVADIIFTHNNWENTIDDIFNNFYNVISKYL